YGSSLNGSQGNLGPRWQVNAATGHFPYPWHSAQIDNGTIGRRLQIKDADLDPELNAGARYFGEGQYIHPQDAAFGNDDNNASYREMRFSRSGVNFFGSWLGATVRTKPAIEAWKAVDP